VAIQGKKLSVKMGDKDAKEVLSLDDIGEAGPGGKVSFLARNTQAVLSGFSLAGNLDTAKYQALVDDLKAKGSLVQKEPEKPKELPPLRGAKKSAEEDDSARKKEAEEDL
jgi:hypothetical protein